MNKLLQAPWGCPTYGKEHPEPPALRQEPGQSGSGEEAALQDGQHTSLHPAEPSHLAPPPHPAVGITRSLGLNNEGPDSLGICLGMSQEQFLGSWGETGNSMTPLILCKAPMPGPVPVQPIQPIGHPGVSLLPQSRCSQNSQVTERTSLSRGICCQAQGL